jgi:hypothetical protein
MHNEKDGVRLICGILEDCADDITVSNNCSTGDKASEATITPKHPEAGRNGH